MIQDNSMCIYVLVFAPSSSVYLPYITTISSWRAMWTFLLALHSHQWLPFTAAAQQFRGAPPSIYGLAWDVNNRTIDMIGQSSISWWLDIWDAACGGEDAIANDYTYFTLSRTKGLIVGLQLWYWRSHFNRGGYGVAPGCCIRGSGHTPPLPQGSLRHQWMA